MSHLFAATQTGSAYLTLEQIVFDRSEKQTFIKINTDEWKC